MISIGCGGPVPFDSEFSGDPFPDATNRYLLFYLLAQNKKDLINSMSQKNSGQW